MMLLAQAHEIAHLMRPALGEGEDMVNFLGRGEPPGPLAFLTQRVDRDVCRPDASPRTAIAPVGIGIATVTGVGEGVGLFMIRAESALHQSRAAGVSAGVVRFIRQGNTSKERGPRREPGASLKFSLMPL